jgi:hypothetical protein
MNVSSPRLWQRSCWLVSQWTAAVVSRLPVSLSSLSQSTTAALADPIVSDAMEFFTDSRVKERSPLSCAIVFSTSSRPHSVPTTTPARIWPSSIMLAT